MKDAKQVFLTISCTVTYCRYLHVMSVKEQARDKLTTTRPELHSIPVYSPWYHIRIDFFGPFSPVSQSGN